jgi:Uma2 family endonuclease
MGQISKHETLALRWAELCNDPMMQDLPGKIELNGLGVIEMSPASNRHGMAQAAISHALTSQLSEGTAIVECCISTDDGVRVPDVAWASATFIAQQGDNSPFTAAPEICVEVRSPSNTNDEMEYKTKLYLQAGAVEVWIVTEAGVLQVIDAQGPQAASRYGVTFKLPARPGAL